jgi:glyoxylase-like metal-dependent hydrolase (beta-lactamase superfamily II)
LLRGTTAAHTDDLLQRSGLKNPYETSINVFLFELGARRVLVDVGAGAMFGPGYDAKLVDALAAADVRPEQITDVLVTHVHADHAGGLVKEGRPVFTNATVHVGKPDVDFFLNKANAARTGYGAQYFDQAESMLKPYVAAGRVKAFDRDGEVLPGVAAALHPGHTPGTAFYTLTSRGERLVFIGDIVHVGPVQLPEPKITIAFDQDETKARDVRERAFARFASQSTLIAAPHLPFPGVGRLKVQGEGYRWTPLANTKRNDGGATAKP